MGYRLVAVSGKFGGNRQLPTDKVNPALERGGTCLRNPIPRFYCSIGKP